MNKKLKKIAYALYFIALALGFVVVYYGSYYYALNNMTSDNIITKEEVIEENPALSKTNVSNVQEAGSNTTDIITKKTEYIEEFYDVDTCEITKQSIEPPIAVLGYNRQQLIDYLSNYLAKNNDDTLVNIQLVSFSGKTVVVRKSIRNVEKIYNYYVRETDGTIIVFKADKITRYIDTGISLDDIIEEERDYIQSGFYVETIHELYNYLEGITS